MSTNTKDDGKSLSKDDGKSLPSRRGFLSTAGGALAGGALLMPTTPGAQALGAAGPQAASEKAIPPTRISPDFTASLAAAPIKRPDFSMEGGISGAQIFANLCKDEGLAAMFTSPGSYGLINAIAEAGIPCYGGRNESSMASAADGFYKVTGEVVATCAEGGPGVLMALMGVGTAHLANTPLLVLAGNWSLRAEDSLSGMQFLHHQPCTEPIRKYGKRILVPNRVFEYGAYAFRNLKTGVPGVVHLDFPSEVESAKFTDPSQLTDYRTKEQYRSESCAVPAPKEVAQAVDMINRAERPLVIAGHGVFHRKAWEPLMRAAEKHEFAVVGSGPMRGHFPDGHRLSGSTSHQALMSADLVVFVGQYCMPTTRDWALAPGVKTIRVHPEASDLGRNWPLDLGIVSDEKLFLEALADGLPTKKRASWVAEVAAARAQYDKANEEYYATGLKYSRDTNTVHSSVVAKELSDFLYKGDIDPKQTVTGLDGSYNRSWCTRWFRAQRPGQSMDCHYQLGAMGPGIGMLVGATAAVKRGVGPQAPYKGAPVVMVTGDGGAGYSIMELDTAAKYKLPLIVVLYINDTWSTGYSATLSHPPAMHMYLMQENLRYDKIAEGLGVRGEYVRTPEEFRAALKRSYDEAAKNSTPSLIAVRGMKEFINPKLYPPGRGPETEPGVSAWHH